MFYKTYAILQLLSVGTVILASNVQGCTTFDSSMEEFSATFKEPQPPRLLTEFGASFIQHKWRVDVNLSHITSGYIENSAKGRYVRVNEAYEGALASSFFDYSNQTAAGLVNNILTEYRTNGTQGTVFSGYVLSNFPIFEPDVLINASAVFNGLVNRPFFSRKVASWGILYLGQIPTTVFTTDCGVLIGYDYFSPDLRTRVVTEFFNVKAS